MKFCFSEYREQLKVLFFNPKQFWEERKQSAESPSESTKMLLFLIAVLAVLVFVGEFFSRSDFYVEYPFLKALRKVLLLGGFYFIGSALLASLMKTFGGKKDKEKARLLIAYSLVPVLFVSLLTGLVDFLYPLDIIGIYGCYVFAVGAKTVLDMPKEREQSFIAIAILTGFFVFNFLSVFLTKLMNAYYQI